MEAENIIESVNGNNRLVQVCASCGRASCWHYEFPCDEAMESSTKLMTVADLRDLKLENSHHYSQHKVAEIYGEAAPHGYRQEKPSV